MTEPAAYILTLPWPSRRLSPNARVHWGELYIERKRAKLATQLECLAAGVRRLDPPRDVAVTITLHPPRSPGLRNIDNVISSLKAALDGIASSLGVDDSRLRITWPVEFAEPRPGGGVLVEITAPLAP